MAIAKEKISFQVGQETVEINKIIFSLDQGTLVCEKIKFFPIRIKDSQILHIIPTDKKKRVSFIQLKASFSDITGELNITDFMLQDGSQKIGHISYTKEMLRKLREYNLPAAPKYFNAVIRGCKTIIIPNRGERLKVALDAPVVTTPIDFILWAKQVIEAGLQFSHFYRTRIFTYLNNLVVEDKLEFLATTWQVKHNDIVKVNKVDYTGLYHECAAGDSRFNIDLISEEYTERPQPSARILVNLQEWEKDKGTLKL